jgi:hypothetical protein
LVFFVKLRKLISFEVKFFCQTGKFILNKVLCGLFFLETHLKLGLEAYLFFKFYLSFFKFLFLGFGDFDSLIAAHDFVLHFVKLSEQLLLLFFRLFSILFALADLSNESLLFLLFEVGFIHNCIAVVFSLLLDLFSFFNETFFVFSDELLFLFSLLLRIPFHFAHNFILALKLFEHFRVCATSQRCYLLSKLS